MIQINWLPRPAAYLPVWQAMHDFTEQRDAYTPDEIWLVEHAPVYTLGQAGKPEHILDAGAIPVVNSNRGGQVTYHGPGQIVVYCLIDLRRAELFVKDYVVLLEDVILDFLDELGIRGACRQAGAPGVYVPVPQPPVSLRAAAAQRQPDSVVHAGRGVAVADAVSLDNPIELAKIAALGIKVRRGCAYHGLALNVDMDLTPFSGINPCGYEGLKAIDLAGCGVRLSLTEAGDQLAQRVADALAEPGK